MDRRIAVPNFLLCFTSRPSLPPEVVHSLILWLLHEDPLIKAYGTITLKPQPMVISQSLETIGASQEENTLFGSKTVA